ncbi:hypothetical protein GOBAR_AA22123 [Gossypium barbadense]|uniref:Uncharacterized protein n=1 Tax=Gossypium barbadense TaxID=3634 RepID=A0A2P5X5E2_GOSBA|nr:hypothetical protein GOBAR_AA22123 [Gossypium barbadense]
MQPTLEEISSENLHEPCSGNNKWPIYEERKLQIEELEEWWTQKLRTPDKPKLSQDELNTLPNQLKAGDKVLLDATDPLIATSKPNEEIPLTVRNIFPYLSYTGVGEANEARHGRATRPWFPHPHSQAHRRALGRAHTTGGDRAMPYGRVGTGKKLFPNTGCDKSPLSSDMAVGKIAKTIWA